MWHAAVPHAAKMPDLKTTPMHGGSEYASALAETKGES